MKLLILFGPPGVGKSFIGHLLSEKYGFYFYDADDDLTPDMIQAIREEQFYTPKMRDHFFNIVIEKIKGLGNKYDTIAVAQTTAKERNRRQLLDAFPEAQFIYIQAEEKNINSRLRIRNDWISVEYANKIRILFESPQLEHNIIDNNSDEKHLCAQFEKFLL